MPRFRIPAGLPGRLSSFSGFVACLLLVGSSAAAIAMPAVHPAAGVSHVSEWEVDVTRPGSYEALVAGGFDVASLRPGYSARVLVNEGSLAPLRALGLPLRLIDPNPGLTLAQRAERELHRPARSVSGRRISQPQAAVPAFGAGSMGGYYTRAEIKAFLDSIIAADTHHIFSKLDTVGWSYRHQPIWSVRVTGPSQPGPKPRVFYNSLIHAREPEGMQALLYFLSTLENGYGADPDLTYLVDQRELYFMPLVNPDGYAANESVYASTGAFGFWRKNTRDNNLDSLLTSQDGVDLNRNFGYKWGYDNIGSSGTRTSEVYRGVSAWSEPETRAVRAWCDSMQFQCGINYHTYSDLLILPYGYANVIAADSARYYEWVADFGRDDHYLYGVSPRILYAANGVSDDWMYGETAEKPRMFSITIEVGDQNDGFWPAPSRILPLAREQLRANAGMAYLGGRFLRAQGPPVVTSGGGYVHAGANSTLQLALKNRGLTQSSVGLTLATLRSADNLVQVTDSISTYGVIAPGAAALPADSGFTIYVDPSLPPGRVLNFTLHLSDGGGYSGSDSFQVVLGTPTTLFADSAETGTAAWVRGGWDTTRTLSHDGAHSFTDSPAGYYLANANNSMSLAQPLSLSGVSNAYLQFWTRWDMEQGYDMGIVEVSADSGLTWTSLQGIYSSQGKGNGGNYNGGVQPAGAPVFDALTHEFQEERMNLTALTGAGKPPIQLRFRLASDGGTEREGWFVDGVRVVSYTDPTPLAVGEDPPGSAATRTATLWVGRPTPNPSRGAITVGYRLSTARPVQAELLTAEGRRVALLTTGPQSGGAHQLTWDARSPAATPTPAGIYFLRIQSGPQTEVRKLVLVP